MSRSKSLPKKGTIAANAFVKIVGEAAQEKKALEIKILDLKGLTDITDYFVICSGNSDVHVKAIVDNIRDRCNEISKPWHVEGYEHRRWVVLDYVDVVVHVFDNETREFYSIERLWADAEIEEMQDAE